MGRRNGLALDRPKTVRQHWVLNEKKPSVYSFRTVWAFRPTLQAIAGMAEARLKMHSAKPTFLHIPKQTCLKSYGRNRHSESPILGSCPKPQPELATQHHAGLRLQRRNRAKNNKSKRHKYPLNKIQKVMTRLKPLRFGRQ